MRFTFIVWAISRIAVALVFVVVARGGAMNALGNWDGTWYGAVVTHGYQYAQDGQQHNVAYFPMFPLLSWIVMRIGIGWPLAGALVSNAAFLGALVAIFGYARDTFGERVARWSVAVACFMPLSFFGSVAYAEAPFMLFSALALWWYRRRQYAAAGIAGALASATRPLGIALAIGLVVAAFVERLSWRNRLAVAVSFAGVASFALYCALSFHDPLAWMHAQAGWRGVAGFDAHSWYVILMAALQGHIENIVPLVLFAAALVTIATQAKRLGASGAAYVSVCIVTILFAGTPFSIDRQLYTVIPVLCVFGAWFARFPPAGYVGLTASAILMIIDTARFAQFQWVA